MTVTVFKVETLEYESDQTVFPWLKNKRVAGRSTEHLLSQCSVGFPPDAIRSLGKV
jgi:hypothetical protein